MLQKTKQNKQKKTRVANDKAEFKTEKVIKEKDNKL